MRASEEESGDDRPFDTSIVLTMSATALWLKYFTILVNGSNEEMSLALDGASGDVRNNGTKRPKIYPIVPHCNLIINKL